MKKICIALLASLACLFVVSCERQEDDATLYSTNKFRVEAPQFLDENGQKVYLHYTDMASSLIYEEGDHVYINGKDFTLNKDGSTWYANSVNGEDVVGKRFLVAYADGEVNFVDSSSSTYHFNLMTTLSSRDHNKVVLGGVANVGESGYVITLQPACAILRINTGGAGASWTYAKVGFDANKIPKEGTLNVSDRTISASGSNFLTGVTAGGAGQFLNMRYSDPSTTGEDDYWYVAIPIPGNSVTTTLYLEWNDGSTTVQRKTQAPVTLQKGYVYTLGTERVSPFNANACGTYFFYVDGSNHRVSFTAGNLQCQRYIDGEFNEHVRWRFAPSQLNSIGDNNSDNINDDGGEVWFDLFGYGTSNWSASGATAYAPYSTSEENTDYYSSDLAGTNADWGVYNRTTPGIYYGSSVVTFNKLRTLTSDEWNFLVGRTGKSGIVCVDGAYKGLMLLPNTGKNGSGTWSNTTDVDLSGLSNTSVTNLSLAQWDALEAIGAIFLPYGGYRVGTTISFSNSNGVYWSATTNNASRGKALTATMSSVASSSTTKKTGCSVRLVANVGSW